MGMRRGRPKRQTPSERFASNLADAELLLAVADGLVNRRARRMRSELRESLGEAFRLPKKQRDRLELLESSHLWMVFKPGTPLRPDQLEDLSPLLRPAIVMACAALETLVADIAIARLGSALASDVLPRRLKEIPLNVGQWMEFRSRYKRQHWGVRGAIEEWIEEYASTAPNKIGELFSAVGLESGVFKRVDRHRGVAGGTTERELNEITARRNRIAHAADRVGSRRATLSFKDAQSAVTAVRSIGHAIAMVAQATRSP